MQKDSIDVLEKQIDDLLTQTKSEVYSINKGMHENLPNQPPSEPEGEQQPPSEPEAELLPPSEPGEEQPPSEQGSDYEDAGNGYNTEDVQNKRPSNGLAMATLMYLYLFKFGGKGRHCWSLLGNGRPPVWDG